MSRSDEKNVKRQAGFAHYFSSDPPRLEERKDKQGLCQVDMYSLFTFEHIHTLLLGNPKFLGTF